MIGLDTNVLLRLFDDTDAVQTGLARALMERSGPQSLRITNLVVAELVWTLKRHYGQPRDRLVQILHQLLRMPQLVFEDRSAVMTASLWFQSGQADFADYLIAAANEEAGAHPTLTFDRAAAAHPAFAPMTPEARP